MLLTIDAGNTQTVLGIYDGTSLERHWRTTTQRDRTPDEHRLWVRAILGLEGIEPHDLTGAAISSNDASSVPGSAVNARSSDLSSKSLIDFGVRSVCFFIRLTRAS